MNQEFLQSISELNYAELDKAQEEKLRELEKQFNEEYGTAYYLIVMDREHK
ncbi:MAG: polynucleotide phosphorylase [Bacillota bacterium]|nr:polynucleotide phosphorylase [Bacillota bacterium]